MQRIVLLSLTACLLAGGCAGRTQVFPNSDKNLRRTPPEFAADAAKRFPYRGGDTGTETDAPAYAAIGYWLNVIDIMNRSETDWENVEIWVNGTHVVHLPKMERLSQKRIPFRALYDVNGQSFPENNKKMLVRKIEVLLDGKLYRVPSRLGEG